MTYTYKCPVHGEIQRDFAFGGAPREVECCVNWVSGKVNVAQRVYEASFGRPYRAAGGNGSS